MTEATQQIIEHRVSPTDTLAGIALKYNVTIPALKQLNGIHGARVNLFAAMAVLKVPCSGGASSKPIQLKKEINKKEIVNQFVSLEKCTAFEAKTYLEECDYDLEQALEKRREWRNTEREISLDSPNPFHSGSPSLGANVSSNRARVIGNKTKNKLEKISNDIFDL